MEKAELTRMYLEEHLTMQQIGDRVGLTRQGVYHWLRKHGIDGSKAERFMVACDMCRQPFEQTRKRFKKSIKHFCCHSCYMDYLRNDEYHQNRNGQRIGRKVMEKLIRRDLRFGEVVHHVDGNDLNNESENLMLFPSHKEHLAWHHRQRQI